MIDEKSILIIDEEGFPLFGELRVADPEIGRELLTNLKRNDFGVFQTELEGKTYFVENFDEPLVVQSFNEDDNTLIFPYEFEFDFLPESLTVDEWDRFHGRTRDGIPWVFSRKAQAQFFEALDEFDDDSITYLENTYEIPPWIASAKDVQAPQFWNNLYENKEGRWELDAPAPALKEMLPRMKWPKSRVLVLGCGSGNDAAYFAEKGHVVTAVDMSESALAQAKKKYGHHENITWLKSDIFKLPREFEQSFDVIFEHTCYCAIDPSQRSKLVKTWLQCLVPGGHLMGIFFVNDKQAGPPFGGLEWEVRERLKKAFQFNFWGRWRDSVPNREGSELFIFAQKR